MDFIQLSLISAITIFVYMTGVFLISLYLKNSSIVDIAWGLGFVLVAFLTLFLGGNVYPKQILTVILVTLWGLRLAIHIFTRNKGKGEDWRYKKWREDWGNFFVIRAYLQIFLLQGVMLLIIANSFIFINSSSTKSLSVLDGIGAFIWIIGFVFEAGGDYQLRKFKSDPENKGRIMTTGLWKYTRHPNYFGEVSMWWGIYVIALSIQNGFLTVFSPLLITFLLLKVSGIPLLEKKYNDNKEYQEYKKRTSSFFPWFPKMRNNQNYTT